MPRVSAAGLERGLEPAEPPCNVLPRGCSKGLLDNGHLGNQPVHMTAVPAGLAVRGDSRAVRIDPCYPWPAMTLAIQGADQLRDLKLERCVVVGQLGVAGTVTWSRA